jgi:hypothetical protein
VHDQEERFAAASCNFALLPGPPTRLQLSCEALELPEFKPEHEAKVYNGQEVRG